MNNTPELQSQETPSQSYKTNELVRSAVQNQLPWQDLTITPLEQNTFKIEGVYENNNGTTLFSKNIVIQNPTNQENIKTQIENFFHFDVLGTLPPAEVAPIQQEQEAQKQEVIKESQTQTQELAQEPIYPDPREKRTQPLPENPYKLRSRLVSLDRKVENLEPQVRFGPIKQKEKAFKKIQKINKERIELLEALGLAEGTVQSGGEQKTRIEVIQDKESKLAKELPE
ncbi:MAG: hypothetical protein ABII07_03730 [Patescibacteria group bacterium]|nr:hypothetical protein [Patescibacteria group bacterium]